MASTLLDEALEGWRYTREGVIAELDNIPPESFGFRAAPAMRSIAELAVHIAESGVMMAGELSRQNGNLQRQSYPEFMQEYSVQVDGQATKAVLIDLLRQSHGEGDAKLRAAGERQMMKPIVQFNGVPAARLSWMSHGVAHEEYHRGQIAMCARLLGLVPALTQLIEGPAK